MKTTFNRTLQWCLVLILFAFSVQQSQAFCLDSSNQVTGTQDGYHYELWNPSTDKNQCMTLGSGALFSGTWSNAADYLARRGVYYGTGTGKSYKNIGGGIQFKYSVDWRPQYVSGGNSNIGVYGWVHSTGGSSANAEFYIVENWYQWNQSMDNTAVYVGTIWVNAAQYDVYKTTRSDADSPFGKITFSQYVSVRRNRGTNNQSPSPAGVIGGTINVSEHFAAWEKLGLNMSGELYEVAFSAEGYKSSGTVNVTQLDISTSMGSPASIGLSQSSYSMNVGDQILLDWTYNPSDYGLTDVVVVSTSSNAACNAVGLWSYLGKWIMTGMSTGTCTLTIFSPDGLKSGTATVTVGAGASPMRILSVRALGSKGGEQIYLLRDGNRINQGYTLTTSYQTFTSNVYGDGNISIEFENDDGLSNGRNARVDYITIDGVKRETESIAANGAAYDANGMCGAGGNTEWLSCKGAVSYGPLKQDHTIAVRARGNAGGEHIVVLINGVAINAGWTLGTSFQTYTVNVTGDGDINIRYDNDGGTKDVVVDWLKVDSQNPRQAENMQYNTAVFANGRCGGGSYSEWMHCNGVIGFGKISDNFN